MKRIMDAKIPAMIRELDRTACETLLADYCCIQTYDSETLDELREAIQVNYDDGTIAGSLVAMTWNDQ